MTIPDPTRAADHIDAAYEAWRVDDQGRHVFCNEAFRAGFHAGRASAEAEVARLRAALTEIEHMGCKWQRPHRLHVLNRMVADSRLIAYAALAGDRS